MTLSTNGDTLVGAGIRTVRRDPRARWARRLVSEESAKKSPAERPTRLAPALYATRPSSNSAIVSHSDPQTLIAYLQVHPRHDRPRGHAATPPQQSQCVWRYSCSSA